MVLTFNGWPRERIWKATKVYKNEYFAEHVRNEAFDVLMDEFSEILSLERYIHERENGLDDAEIEKLRWSVREQEWETEQLLSRLNN